MEHKKITKKDLEEAHIKTQEKLEAIRKEEEVFRKRSKKIRARRIELGISKMELANMCYLPYIVIVDVDNGYAHHFKTSVLENIERVLEIE